jgi:hypothetical protein
MRHRHCLRPKSGQYSKVSLFFLQAEVPNPRYHFLQRVPFELKSQVDLPFGKGLRVS